MSPWTSVSPDNVSCGLLAVNCSSVTGSVKVSKQQSNNAVPIQQINWYTATVCRADYEVNGIYILAECGWNFNLTTTLRPSSNDSHFTKDNYQKHFRTHYTFFIIHDGYFTVLPPHKRVLRVTCFDLDLL